MALWKISVKNSGNAACKNKRQRLLTLTDFER